MTQTIIALVVAVIALSLLTAMSLHANRRFKAQPRLPMQWLGRSVTWTAPRPMALAFTPVIAAICLTALAALTALRAPKTGQEHLVLPLNILVALTFVGAHALHLWLIQRTLQKER